MNGLTRRVAVGALTALLIPLLAACGTAAQADGDAYTASDGSTVILAPDKRFDIPVVEGTALDGSAVELSAWRGDVVVVNFWASWCVTCRDESTALARVSDETKGRGVRFLGIATRDTADNAKAFLRSFPVGYPSLLDDPATNTALLAFRGTLPVASTPTTYVLDRQGRIAARAIGAVDRSRLLGLIDPVLAEGR